MFPNAVDLAERVVNSTVEKEARESFLRIGLVAQRIAANANTDELTLLDLFMQASQAIQEHNSWMDW